MTLGISSHRTGTAVVAVVALCLLSYVRPTLATEPEDAPVGRAVCERVWTGYVETLKTVDPVKIAGWFTKDAVLIYPDKTELQGREAIQAAITPIFRDLKFHDLTLHLTHCAVAGNEAHSFATLDETFQKRSEPVEKSQARCGVVWRRQSDGTWQIAHFLVNYAKP